MSAKSRNRKVWIAVVLSILVPGVGHLYAGAPRFGLLLLAIFFLGLMIGSVFGLYATFFGFVSLALFSILFMLIQIVTAGLRARAANPYQLRWYNRWYWYVLAMLLISALLQWSFINRGEWLGYETYTVPAGSMSPTIESGDFILVNTRYSNPKIGDVVAFQYSDDPQTNWVKRIAALGGNTISIQNGDVIVDGEVRHELKMPDSSIESKRPFTAYTVPEGQVFYLGDSRGNSMDSRFWGTRPQDGIVGEVAYIWFSQDFDRIGRRVE